MTIPAKDWIEDAIQAIISDSWHVSVREILEKHCPFKPNVAYMEVGELISALKNSGIDTTCGACMEIAYTGITVSDHTCKQSTGPLLQCIECKNTESPAGAMARQFNHGRCLHCGSYFKVVRA